MPYIGEGANRWALVHVDDIAELYVRALDAPAGAVYAGVSGQNLPLKDIALALSRAAGCPGRTVSLTLDQARERMGPIADAFALDQRFTGARARDGLGWVPAHLDALAELAQPNESAAPAAPAQPTEQTEPAGPAEPRGLEEVSASS
ncbi:MULTISPECIES: hypothetical protein [unclassified Streptomyces]|uniref:hypothetical protein n=1 Tax=unclassified Streptomyces TaxID=2593676 RepID=UPI0032D59492